MHQPALRFAGIGAALLLLGLAGAPRPAQVQERAGWLGVYTQRIDENLRDGIGHDGDGVLVTRVVNDSPADRAGIRRGDVISAFAGRSVDSPSELMSAVRARRSGESVNVIVYRDGDRRSVSVRLGARPSGSDDDDDSWDDDDDRVFRAPTPPVPPAPPAAPREPRFERFDFPEGSWMFSGMGRGRLGVRVEEVNEEMADALGVGSGEGVLIVEVIDDTPAKRAGLRAGDVIVRVEDREIDDVSDLTSELREREAGPVSLTVVRRGDRRQVTATLERSRSMRWERGPLSLREDRMRDRSFNRRAPRADREDDAEMRAEIEKLREEVKKLQDELDSRGRDDD